jgi:hypothetical protein
MTTLMLQELSPSQIEELDEQDTRTGSDKGPGKNDPWNPRPKPSRPAVMPWWQKQRKGDEPQTGPVKDAIWRKIGAG